MIYEIGMLCFSEIVNEYCVTALFLLYREKPTLHFLLPRCRFRVTQYTGNFASKLTLLSFEEDPYL